MRNGHGLFEDQMPARDEKVKNHCLISLASRFTDGNFSTYDAKTVRENPEGVTWAYQLLVYVIVLIY